ncbi:MAG: hypothetical protein HY720_14810 [Planctomycetes bacterium]|nr:hypothetical protein [Planctomycetota bacterium]
MKETERGKRNRPMRCPACGCDRNEEGALVCGLCRAKLPAPEMTPPAAAPPTAAWPPPPSATPPIAPPLAAPGGPRFAPRPGIQPCPACGRNVAPGLVTCQFCGALAAGPASASNQAVGLQMGMAELALARNREGFRRRKLTRKRIALEAVLFLIMSPMAAPSILITFLQAKRWGRVPVAWVAIDAIILLALSFSCSAHWGSGDRPVAVAFLFPVMLVATIAFSVLAVLRGATGKLERGIFLGYSNLTLLPLVTGGLAFFAGLATIAGYLGEGASAGKVPVWSWIVMPVGAALLGVAAWLAREE